MAAPSRFNTVTIALGLPPLPENSNTSPVAAAFKHTTIPDQTPQPAQLPSPPLKSPASTTRDPAFAMDSQQEQRLKKPSRQVAPSDVAAYKRRRNAENKEARKQRKMEEKAASKAAAARELAASTAEEAVTSTANDPTFGAPISAAPVPGAPIAGDATSHAGSTDVVAGQKHKRLDSGFDDPRESAEEFLRKQQELFWAMPEEEREIFGLNHKERKTAKRRKAREHAEAAAASASKL